MQQSTNLLLFPPPRTSSSPLSPHPLRVWGSCPPCNDPPETRANLDGGPVHSKPSRSRGGLSSAGDYGYQHGFLIGEDGGQPVGMTGFSRLDSRREIATALARCFRWLIDRVMNQIKYQD